MSKTSFTDRDGDVFTAEAWTDPVDGAELMELSVQATDGDNLNMQFYKADAVKIIHLIAEAVEVMIKTAKANGWNEGYAAGMDLQVPEPCA